MIEHRRPISFSGALALLVVTAGLGGCGAMQRTEPPAPIIDGRRPPPESVVAERGAAETRPQESARVYAYQPPPGLEPTPGEPLAPAVVPSPNGQPADRAADGAPRIVAPQSPVPPQPVVREPNGNQQLASIAPTAPPVRPVPESTTPALPAPETRTVSSGSLKPPELTPAVDALVQQAERQRQTGDFSGAAATLERALRLQSREGYLWNRLAHVRLEQGLATQAANLAARANDLSGDQENLKRDNWQVIANARQRAGDVQGAQDAQRKASGG